MIEQRIKAYFGEYAVPGVVYAVQGDTGRVFVFESQDLQLTGDQTAALMCLRPNGTAFSYAGTIDTDDQTITVELDDAEGALTEAGVVAAQLVLQEDGQVLCSFRLGIIVQEVLGGEATPEEKTFVAGLQAQLDEWIAEAGSNFVPSTRKVNGSTLGSDVTIQAAAIPYDNTNSGLTATNAQDALDELADEKLDTSDATVNGKALPAQLYVQDIPSKNLLPNNGSTTTINGVTFTVNSDGTISTSGTASAEIDFQLKFSGTAPDGNYYLSGNPTGGSNSTYRMYLFDNVTQTRAKAWDGITASGNDFGDGVEVQIVASHTMTAVINIKSGTNMNGLTFHPMIRLATIEDDTYVPYAKTNVELTSEVHVKTESITTGAYGTYSTGLNLSSCTPLICIAWSSSYPNGLICEFLFTDSGNAWVKITDNSGTILASKTVNLRIVYIDRT